MLTRSCLVSVLAGWALFSGGQAAAQDVGDYHRINLTLTEDYIVPRYEALAEATEGMVSAVGALCEAPSEALLAESRQAFHRAMDAWMNVQHLSLGPVELEKRRFRLQFWPDKHNTGGKQLSRLLAGQSTDALHMDAFHDTSVAIQGFPALERVMFSDEMLAPGEAGHFRCVLSTAIAENIAGIAAAILREWTAEGWGHVETITSARFGNDTYLDSGEITTLLFEDLDVALLSILDLKLLRPLGAEAGKEKPRRAESWRSGRSLQNVQINLEALHEMYFVGFRTYAQTADLTAMDRNISNAFIAAQVAATAIKLPLAEAVADPEARQAVVNLRLAVRALQAVLRAELAAALDIRLGFNAQDGD